MSDDLCTVFSPTLLSSLALACPAVDFAIYGRTRFRSEVIRWLDYDVEAYLQLCSAEPTLQLLSVTANCRAPIRDICVLNVHNFVFGGVSLTQRVVTLPFCFDNSVEDAKSGFFKDFVMGPFTLCVVPSLRVIIFEVLTACRLRHSEVIVIQIVLQLHGIILDFWSSHIVQTRRCLF
ncbi:hypothetical protein C8J56DRAFT_1070226 [Mycena floridula]|nr:hypothetical protein C8J56DRAFT_1070226 [Mycena floridula]